MRKMTLKHVAAVSHAERYAIPHIVPNMSPRHRQEIEDDLERLAEVKQNLLKQIYHPGLQFPVDPPEASGNGNTNRTEPG